MSWEDIEEWQALNILESTEADPDPTEWDDPATLQAKLDRNAERMNR